MIFHPTWNLKLHVFLGGWYQRGTGNICWIFRIPFWWLFGDLEKLRFSRSLLGASACCAFFFRFLFVFDGQGELFAQDWTQWSIRYETQVQIWCDWICVS